MPTPNNHTVIEMAPRGRERSPRRANPTDVHRTAQPSSRGPSPSPNRNGTDSRMHPTTSNDGHLDVPHANDNAPLSRNRRDTNHASNDHLEPLLEKDDRQPLPPIAGPEMDEDIDENNGVPATMDDHPGVDDGFFTPGSDQDPSVDSRFGNDETNESIANPNGDNKVHGDEVDGLVLGLSGNYIAVPSHMMYSSHLSENGRLTPRFKPDAPFPMPEFIPVDARITPDVNVYQQKKNLAQGMMDLALLSANANQLRYVLEAGIYHPYYYPSLVFISASLILQIAVGVGLILNSRYNVKEHDDICKADRINDLTIIGIFLITIVNVFVASFGVATSPYVQPVAAIAAAAAGTAT